MVATRPRAVPLGGRIFVSGLFGLLGLILALALLVAPVVAVLAYRRAGRLQREIDLLRARLDELTAGRPAAGRSAPPLDDAPRQPTADREAPAVEPAMPDRSPTDAPETVRAPAQSPTPAVGRARSATTRQGFEQSLTSRWLVWLGGVALALGAAFLVKYSIDAGLLSPAVRVALGVLFGLVLIATGEALRRRPLEQALASIAPSQVPPALTAAGVAALFASVYAAYGLYAMVPALLAFALLAAIALTAIGLALLHGPFIAVLGIIGGYVTPALVASDSPAAEALFPYLLVLASAALALMWRVHAWWLGWFTLAGAAFWPALWLAFVWQPGDGLVLGPYLILLAAVFLLLRTLPSSADLPRGLSAVQALLVPWLAAVVVSLLMFALVRVEGYGTTTLVCAAVLVAGLLAAERRDQDLDGLAIVGAVLAVLVLAAWHLPRIVTIRPPMYVFDGREVGTGLGPVVPPELLPFVMFALLLAGLVAAGGFASLWGARRPALWAGVSAATPALLLAVAYWRIEGFELDFAWAAAALCLAVIMVLATDRVGRYRQIDGLTAATGAYAAGVVAALSLALAMSLQNAWLTAALALQVPALAWIEARLDLRQIRALAGVVVAVVLVRLVANYQVLDYPLGTTPGWNWLLYGYGVPALAFFWSARQFRRRGDDLLVTLLEAAALVFLVLLLTLQLRHFMSDAGTLTGYYRLDEQAWQACVWLTIALVLYARKEVAERSAARWGWRLLAGIATLQIVLLHGLFSNPMITNHPVGDWPVVNVLLIAYALPALLYAGIAYFARGRRARYIAGGAGGVSLLLAFIWLSLEVRRAFQGSQLSFGATSDAEWYSYSLAWLVFAALLLAVALWRHVAPLRYASLVLVLVTVAKVFLIDMSALTGVYRALSFIGLGLALVGVGWLYRRFVFVPAADPAASAAPPA